METLVYVLKEGISIVGFLFIILFLSGTWGLLYEGRWGRRSNLRTALLFIPGVLLASAVFNAGVLIPLAIVGVFLSRIAMWATAKQEAKERLAAEALEAQRQFEATMEGERKKHLDAVLEKQRQRKEAEEAARKVAQRETEKARLRTEREAASALKALHSHLEVITSAVRSLQPGTDNAVLLNTIDGELKAIGRNAAITSDMLADPEVREDAALVAEMLAEKGISDKILFNRFAKLFGVGS